CTVVVKGTRAAGPSTPSLHDALPTGSVEDLGAAVQLMAEHQLGKTLSDENVRLIVAFLESLTGEPTAEQMREPQLPPSTDKTPKDRKSTRLNSSHVKISYAVFCLKKK